MSIHELPRQNPGTSSHESWGLRRALSIVVVLVVVPLGVWVAGGLVTNDETLAKTLTGVWLALSGAVVLWAAWRWRPIALFVVPVFIVVAATLGGYLFFTSTVDKVVDEQVVAVDPPERDGDSAELSPVNVQVARGQFESGAHPTSGVATVIDTTSGQRVLTLTNFATDPGPDLRVYVVAAGSEGVDGAVDLGALKGNEGDQQYAVPRSADLGRVVIWCRAFSVNFGEAALRA